MATFVSMMTWHRNLATVADIDARIDREELRLVSMGMHAIIFVPEDAGPNAAVLVSRCADHAAAATIARRVIGDALIRVDSLRFDDPQARPAWLVGGVPSPRPRAPKGARARKPAQLAA